MLKNENIYYKKDFNYFLNKIKNNEHFRYSRFNDGELVAVIGSTPKGANCDGHQYFPEMGKKLKDVLLNYKNSEDYVLESFDHWYNNSLDIKKILHDLKTKNPELEFLNTDFIRIAHEQEPENFIKFLEILKTKKMVIVGPSYLKKLDKYFNFRYVEVPQKNCYLNINRIVEDMKKISDIENDVFFLLSASMPANIIIDMFDDGRNTYLDWGSVWDTFFISPEFRFIRKRSSSNKVNIIEKYKNYWI